MFQIKIVEFEGEHKSTWFDFDWRRQNQVKVTLNFLNGIS